MKKLVLFLVLMAASMAASAQWSIGADVRWAPFGSDGDRHNVGTDIVVNYTHDFRGGFYLMPSVGLFYKNYYSHGLWEGGPGHYPVYQTGFDVVVVGGKKFNLSKGSFSIFTGPRYAYAYATKTLNMTVSPNSLDWRIGIGYTVNKITLSLKADIGCLKTKYDYQYFIYDYDHSSRPRIEKFHSTTFSLGVAYNF